MKASTRWTWIVSLVAATGAALVLAFVLSLTTQGGGHYDQALERLRRSGPVFVLGLAFAGQEVDRLALEPHDQTLDAVLTEAGYRSLPQA